MRVGKANGDDWLRLSEAAQVLGMSLNTVRRWSDSGSLPCYRSPGGHRRFRRADVEALLAGAGRRLIGGVPGAGGGAGRWERLRTPLSALAQVTAEAVGVTSCAFVLQTGEREALVIAEHVREGEALYAGAGETVPLEELPVVAEVLKNRRRLVIADLAGTTLLPRSAAERCLRQGHVAILALPLDLGGGISGVIELSESRAPRTFTGANVTFAEFMGRQASRLCAGDDKGGSVSDQVVDSLALPRSAAEPGRPRTAEGGETGSVLATALRLGDEVAGPLEAYGAGDGAADATDRRAVPPEPADADCTPAATRARRAPPRAVTPAAPDAAPGPWSATEHAGDPLGSTAMALRAMTRQGDEDRLAGAALAALCDGAGLSACVLHQLDGGLACEVASARRSVSAGGGTTSPALAATSPPTEAQPWRLEDFPAAARAIVERAPVAVPAGGGGLTPEAAERFLASPSAGEALVVPLVFDDEAIGLLVAIADTGALSPAGAELATATARLLAGTLGAGEAIARLRRRNHDLELVIEAGLEDSALLSTQDVLHAVSRRLSEVSRSPVADIYAVEGDTLRALVSYDGGRLDPEWEGVVVPLDRYPQSRRAVRTAEISIAASLDDPELTEEGRLSLEKWGYQAQLSMPLIAGGRVIGLVELSDYAPRDFSPELELVRGLGQVAAHALENASLFEQAERRSKVLDDLADLALLSSRTRDIHALLGRIAERLLEALDAANCDVFQVSEEGLRCVASYDRSGPDEHQIGRLLDLETYPALLHAIDRRQVLIVTSPDDPQLSDEEKRTYRDYGFASEVCVPLVVNDELYGIIDIYDTRERDYAEYLPFLRSAAQSLAGAFENSRLLEQLSRRTGILREIVELGAMISQAKDLDDVLGVVAGRLRETIEAADCDIFALQGEQLRCLVSADLGGLDPTVVGHVLDIDKFPATAIAVRSGEIMTVTSLDDPRLTEQEREDMGEWGFQSELCIPLVSGERVIGLIDVFDKRPRDYGEYLDFLKSVGQMAAGAIENALLVAELERRNTALAELVELGKVVSGAGGLDELVRAVGSRVVAVVGAQGCQVFRLQDDMLHCVVTYDSGAYLDDYAPAPLSLGLFPSTVAAIERREALVIQTPDDPRLSDYERELYRESGSQSEVCVPLRAGQDVVGLLDVYDDRPRDYAEHVDFLMSVGQIVAGAFANAFLVERLEGANRTLKLLVESGIELGGTLELAEVLQTVGRRLCAAAAAPLCDIYVVEGELLRCVACVDHGSTDEEFVGTTYRLDDLFLVQEALSRGEPIVVPDLEADPRISDWERTEELRWGNRSKIELPLVSRGEVIGIAGVFDDHVREFEGLEMLRSLAQVAANALANATVFDRLDRSAERMALVNDVSSELSSLLDLDEVLRSAASRLCAIAGVPACDVYRLRGDDLVNLVSVSDGDVDLSWEGRVFPLREWAAPSKAVDGRLPVLVSTLDDSLLLPGERAEMERWGETGELTVPLIAKDRVIGVLELLEHGRPLVLTQDEIATIFAVSRVAALAIENADLVDDLQLRNRENALLNDIARATGTSLDLRDIAAGALGRLREFAPFDRAFIGLLREGGKLEVAFASEGRAQPLPEFVDLPPLGALLERLTTDSVVTLTLPADLPTGFTLPGLDDLAAATLVALTRAGGAGAPMGILALGSAQPGAFDAVDDRLLERVGAHLSLAVHNAELYSGIKRMHLSNLKALSSALNAKDYYTLGHAARVAAYMVLLGRELGWEPELLNSVEEAAYLHDIGKIGVSDRVLLKPGGLNAHEWELMRQHPVFSADIIRPLFEEGLVAGVRHHHERWDGAGYPDGLAGEDIPLVARAMCVADSYDAMSFRRPYRQGLSYDECLAEFARCGGSQFDPAIVAAFVRVLESMAEARRTAKAVAEEAAARIDPAKHATLRSREDEARSEYTEITATLRAVCEGYTEARYIMTSMRAGKRTVVVCDSASPSPDKPHIGDEMVADDELLEVFADREADANVLFVDRWGVWISATTPLRDADGRVTAAVTAEIAAVEGVAEIEGIKSTVTQTLATLMTSTASLDRAEVEAITDGLTGLYNHRYFHERLREELDRCAEQDGRLALLFCDLDDFHAFNELHGHSAGDGALRAVARVIEDSVRHIDLAARYGGEEFAAILLDTDEHGAREVAERIRAGILAMGLSAGAEPLSVSIGLAACPADATFKEELIDKADWAMYLAKRSGRDQVMSFATQHGSDTPERAATVSKGYVSAMADLIAAREAYEQRRVSAVAHLAVEVGRELGLDAAEVRDAAGAAGAAAPAGPLNPAQRIVALAGAYQAIVADRPYRPQLSEAEALDDFLASPALHDDHVLATAFAAVLGRESRA